MSRQNLHVLLPSFGSDGEGLDDAIMEKFWSSMQTELLNRKKRKTRVELRRVGIRHLLWNRSRVSLPSTLESWHSSPSRPGTYSGGCRRCSSSQFRLHSWVQVPPKAQSLFAFDRVFLMWSDHSEWVFGRFLAAYRESGDRSEGADKSLQRAPLDVAARRNRAFRASRASSKN